MTPTTYWIARVEQYLSVYAEAPTPRMRGFSGTLICSAHVEHWQLFGLPHEPAPGECWEVRWEPISILRDFAPTATERAMVPIARNVTEELRSKEAK